MTTPPAKERASVTGTTERTEAGEQMLIPGVRVLSARERLELLATKSLTTSKPQKPLDIGLFDEVARNQLSLF
jgi:hypothetical protein